MRVPRHIKSLLFSVEFAFAWATWLTGTVLPIIIKEFNLDLAQAGLIGMVQNLAAVPMVYFAGHVSQQKGPHKLMLLGLLIIAASSTVLITAGSFLPLLIILLVLGAGAGIVEPTTNAIVGHASVPNKNPLYSLLHAAFGIGGTLVPLIAALLINWGAGWRGVSLTGAALAVFGGLWYIFASRAARKEFPADFEIPETEKAGTKSLWRYPSVWLMGLAVMFFTGSYRGLGNWVVTYFEFQFQASHAVAAIAMSILYASITAGRLLTIKVGEFFKRTTTLLLYIGLGSVFLLILPLGNQWVTDVCVALFGITTGGIFPILFALAAEEFPGRVAAVTALLIVFSRVGGIFSPYLLGLIGKYSNLNWSMFANAGFAILGTLFFCLLALHLRKRDHHARVDLSEGETDAPVN